MKRYGLFYQNGHDGEMEESPDGEYVQYSQANAQLQLKNETIDGLMQQLNQVTRERDHFKTACELADALRNHERGMGPK